ncbi:aminodeoxychorismate lyase [Microlunatus panaciterrae]|uniref:Branched-chain amino acid aminotransferase n=1 Tax=Microlunatus panaciterrae TaxID=400768 RepID=A0ABS2RDM8_9ACTN|nr:aminotransferase class IV [Microlunatus panaciterrae]MBM7797096.1 branched-chain amino acid aminotransferase [Microlunatus panaciterrae]
MATTVTSAAPITDELRVWLDGRIQHDPTEPALSVLDHGVTVGDGVFEALKVTAAGPFSVQRHLDRLTRSARAMNLPDPDHDLVRDAISAVLAGRSWTEGKVRITYTGGRGPLGSQQAFGPPTLIVAADARVLSRQGASIVTTPWTRNTRGAMTGVKTTSYAENVRGLAYAADRDASEGIFINTEGHLCEGTGSNIFCVFGTRIVTPPLSAGPLAGITRALLLEWCDIDEADVTLAEALSADEVFLSSSLRDVQSVARWDAVDFGRIGPVTRQVIDVFAQRSTADLEP